MVEVGGSDEGDDQGGCGCTDLRPYLIGGGPVGRVVRVIDMGDEPPHWKIVGRIQSQCILQADTESTLAR